MKKEKKLKWEVRFVAPVDGARPVRLNVISERRVRLILGSVSKDQRWIDGIIEDGEFDGMWNVGFYRLDKIEHLMEAV